MIRNIITTMLISFILSSCATYLDRKNLSNDFYELYVYDEYNIYKNKNQIKETADTEVYSRNNFKIKLPKKIIRWQSGTSDIFEYPLKQIIFINPGNSDKKKEKKEWILRDANDNEIFNYLNSYWHERGYSNKRIKTSNKKRISKIYSNNITIILLYNIKEENFESFKNLIKTFRYLN